MNTAYQILTNTVSGRAVHKARGHCSQCGAHEDIPWDGKKNDSQGVAAAFQAAGWRFDPFDPARCLCPDCAEKKGGDPVVTSAAKQAPAVRRDLSAEEREKVRALLDRHFDAERGAYSDEYSDKRIGEETNVPFAYVSQIREIGYGPIKNDWLVVELTDDFKKLQADAQRLKEEAATFQVRAAQVEKAAQKALKRLRDVDPKAAVAEAAMAV